MNTLREIARIAARRYSLNVLLVAAVLATVSTLGGMSTEMRHLPVEVQHPAEAIAAEHDCWTGEAPAHMQGVIPGHVVVTRDGRTIYGGSALVGKALEQVFDGVDHGLTVHAFCA